MEILPRLEGKSDNFVRVRSTSRRKGDKVMRGTIEVIGNAFEKHEKIQIAQMKENRVFNSWSAFKDKVLFI